MKHFFVRGRAYILPAVLLALTVCACAPSGTQAESGGAAPPSAEETTPGAAAGEPERDDPVETLLASMTVEEKVGQLFFVRCPAENAAEDVTAYHLGGVFLFGRDFKDSAGNWLTEEAFVQTVESYQNAAAIPLLIGVDEEGGSVVRASANPNLFPGGKCKSPQYLFSHQEESHNVFSADAWEKNSTLLRLGINVNLAPVCDISTDPADFIYDRTLGQDAQTTAAYVTSVVTAMGDCGIGSVLKHFPGYGGNADTHTGVAVDERPYENFVNEDFLPFRAGIEAGAGSVLVSHNIVTCMDAALPASLSPEVHRVLREELGFEGVILTDDLAMDALKSYAEEGTVAVLAVLAGNDMLVTTDYRTQIPQVLAAVEDGTVSEETLNAAAARVLRWKQSLGLLEAAA